MPLADLIAEVAHRLFIEVIGAILEVPIRWLGYILIKYVFYLGQRDVDWESNAVLVVGIVGWLVIGIAAYILWPSSLSL